ncbi:hypothetical protein GCM10007047_20430 [Cerasicoccus arenae]|uniref:Right handed beta helix domain-containing protein n=2 Tax=Cerasicoccus arenae TaxID=424488 RepID=A0A8J3DIK8_9BACT|nr:hypothetical protein GCM10007047_20430 [Cerasicoccus arenae]
MPNDSLCDMGAIDAAIHAAIEQGASQLIFDAGVYNLRETVSVPGFGHDNYMVIDGAKALELVGAVDSEGLPATRLERNIMLSNEAKPAIQLRVRNCQGLALKNFILCNDPPMGSTARVISVDKEKDQIVVEVLPSLPAYDGMRAASAHAWDQDTGKLKRFGATPAEATLTIGLNVKAFWAVVPESNGRQLEMSGAGFAEHLELGDLVSWHHKSTDAFNQIEVLYSEDILFENINLPNVSNAGMLAGYNRNMTLRKMRFEPENGNLAVGGRDGIHLSNTMGELLVEDCYFKGLRMDPLVIRKSFGFIEKVRPGGVIVVKTNLKTAGNIPPGDSLRFWTGDEPQDRVIFKVESLSDKLFLYSIEGELPQGVQVGGVISFQSYSLTKGVVRDCVFEGNFGSAIVNFEENIVIEDCVFRDNAYQIKFGANFVSGAFARNVIFRNNRCEDVSWVDIARRGQPSILMIHSLNRFFENPMYNQSIEIYGNVFCNPDGLSDAVAIDVRNAADVYIHGNVYEGFGRSVNVDEGSTRNIRVEGATSSPM